MADQVYMALWDDREIVREALWPFAALASGGTFEGIPDDHIVLRDKAKKLTAGDFRRAAKVYFESMAGRELEGEHE